MYEVPGDRLRELADASRKLGKIQEAIDAFYSGQRSAPDLPETVVSIRYILREDD